MKEKIALISIGVNVLLGLVKITAGFLSGSVAVLSEGIHSSVDILSSAICFLGIKIAKKPVDKNHPYGHYKFEVLAGVIITFILAATGALIVWQSYKNFFKPAELNIGPLTLGVMLFSAVVNEIMARLKIYHGKKENTVSLLSEGIHSRIDVLSSMAIFIGLILVPYWPHVDPLLALLVGLYILKESFSLGKEATDSLLDVSAGEEVENKIKEVASEQNMEISNLKTQKKGSIITANLEIKLPSKLSVEEATGISNNLRKKLIENVKNLEYVTIQIKSHEISTGFYKPMFGGGFGWQRRGKFKEEMKEAKGLGPGGYCTCPKCNYRIEHGRGTPCASLKCPKCNVRLIRK